MRFSIPTFRVLRSFIGGLCVAVAALAFSGIVSSAYAVTNACTIVTHGYTEQVTASSVCKTVINAASMNLCAVTETSGEWSSFYSNTAPSGITINACTNLGYYYSGYFYFVDTASGGNSSCDTVCTGHGSCNLSGTLAIGSSDTTGAAACNAVATGILGSSYTATRTTSAGVYAGCNYYNPKGTISLLAYDVASTTCAYQPGASHYRFCACSSCAGYAYGGYCYYASGTGGANCDTVCSTHGGTDQAGTQYVGSSDSSGLGHCTTLATHFLGTVTPTYSTSSGYNSGCSYSGTKGSYVVVDEADAVTTASATPPSTGFRFCACAN